MPDLPTKDHARYPKQAISQVNFKSESESEQEE